MLAMADVNTSRTEKMPTAVLCARERTMLRDRRRRAFGNSCRQARDARWRPCQPGRQATRGGPDGRGSSAFLCARPGPACPPAPAQEGPYAQSHRSTRHRSARWSAAAGRSQHRWQASAWSWGGRGPRKTLLWKTWVSLPHSPGWAGGAQAPGPVGPSGRLGSSGKCWREASPREEGQGSHCGKMRSWMKQMKQKTNRAQAT